MDQHFLRINFLPQKSKFWFVAHLSYPLQWEYPVLPFYGWKQTWWQHNDLFPFCHQRENHTSSVTICPPLTALPLKILEMWKNPCLASYTTSKRHCFVYIQKALFCHSRICHQIGSHANQNLRVTQVVDERLILCQISQVNNLVLGLEPYESLPRTERKWGSIKSLTDLPARNDLWWINLKAHGSF